MSVSELVEPARAAIPDSAHAVLLFGAEGAGLVEAAQQLAARWLCAAPIDGEACGACRICLQVQRWQCPDLLAVEPKGASAVIRIGTITPRPPEGDEEAPLPVQVFLRTPPLAARHKVVVIQRAERMNVDSANALLKILEEPEAHAKFVLTTNFLSAVRPTVVSRCVLVARPLETFKQLQLRFPDADPEVLRLASGSQHRLEMLLEASDAIREIGSIASRLGSAPRGAALALSDSFRGACDALEQALKLGARPANAEGWRMLAFALRNRGASAAILKAAVESHRLITGNSHDGLVADAFFVRWTGER